jgi:hypothetical protein
MTRKNFLINLFLISALVFLNVVLSQGSTLFKTENRGFRLITNQDPNLVFELSSESSENNIAYLAFGYKNLASATINSSRFIIEPSVGNIGSILYSESPTTSRDKVFIGMNMNPNASSVKFIWQDESIESYESIEGLQRFPKIYGNIKDLIAIYNCPVTFWTYGDIYYSSRTYGTCLGKRGLYSATPPGATTYLGSDRGAKIYVNPSTCFGDDSGIVLQEICTGNCDGDDGALTICIRTK